MITKRIVLTGSILLVCVLTACRTMTTTETGFLNREISVEGTNYPYVVYVPRDFDPSRSWPIILFLHGAGERGEDGLRQTQVGIGEAIRWNAALAKAVVVMPQAPTDERWLNAPAEAALASLDRSMTEFNGDPDRVYLTGMSMGGYGTYALAFEQSEKFAAIVPVCGGILPHDTSPNVRQLPATIGAADPYGLVAARLRDLPIRIFHGAKDDIVPPSESRQMHEALKALGADVRYTEYPKVGHGAWQPAYSSPELWEWLLRQRRAKR